MTMHSKVPDDWTDDVLQDHVAEIVFNAGESYNPACLLCRRAKDKGFFAPYDDGGEVTE